MAYTVDNFGKTAAYTVNDGKLNKETHMTLVGKNYYGYGEQIAENLLHLMENFSSEVEPTNGVTGQIYYKPSDDLFYKFDGTDWLVMHGSSVREKIVKADTGADHKVTVMYDVDGSSGTGLIAVAIISAEVFTLHESEEWSSTNDDSFHVINKGITLNQAPGTDYKFHGTATTAQYADLAELYKSDAEYTPGTVVKIGGEAEVTQTTDLFCTDVFGIVSTDPAYLMNSTCEGMSVAVALEGRVPCKVIGQVKKGDRLLSSEEPGVARVASEYELQEVLDWYRIVGRALEDKTTESIGLIEVVVGAK